MLMTWYILQSLQYCYVLNNGNVLEDVYMCGGIFLLFFNYGEQIIVMLVSA